MNFRTMQFQPVSCQVKFDINFKIQAEYLILVIIFEIVLSYQGDGNMIVFLIHAYCYELGLGVQLDPWSSCLSIVLKNFINTTKICKLNEFITIN